jgi:hypothetical protein
MRRRVSVHVIASAAMWTALLAPGSAQAQSCDSGQPAPTSWYQRWCRPFLPGTPPTYPVPESAPGVLPNTETTPNTEATPSPLAGAMPNIGAFGSEAGGAIGGGSAAFASANVPPPGGYLDNPIPVTTFRLRYDSQSDFNRFDRAAYFYAPWHELSFHNHAIVNSAGQIVGVQQANSKANGFPQLPGRLDQQVVANYLEYAPNKLFSLFVNVPFRFVHTSRIQEDPDLGNPLPNGGRFFFPEPGVRGSGDAESFNNNTGGLGDIDFGVKAALIADPDRYLTLQFRTYVPTGVASVGMGTGHVSLEPSLLFYQRLTNRLIFQAQAGDWIPIGGTPLAGNVVDWGFGFGYDAYRNGTFKVTPVVEMLGWDVLSGGETVFQPIPILPGQVTVLPNNHGVRNAAGDTIINSKIGTRSYWGNGQSIYLGWGHALTADRWYRDDARIEYRLTF